MPNISEAYDFTLFEDRIENAAPAQEPRKREEPKRDPRQNVIEIPKEDLEKNRKPKRHPFRMMVAGICFTVIFGTSAYFIFNQVRLTELTEDLNQTTMQLKEAESEEIQLSMQASQKMNNVEVEKYAQEQLGMSKVNEGQVTYVNIAQEDKGTVVQDADTSSFLDKLMETVKSWFA